MEYVADFETTRDFFTKKQRVWLAGIAPVGKDTRQQSRILTSMQQFLDELAELNQSDNKMNVFFHNLKFDGSYLVYYFLHEMGLEWVYKRSNKLQAGEFTTNVNQMGQVFSISYNTGYGIVNFRDSLKIFTASEKTLAESYHLPTLKGEIDYKKRRDVGYKPTQEEIDYIINDLFIISTILFKFRNEKFEKNTIASSALNEFCKMNFAPKLNNGYVSLRYFRERHPITLEQDEQIRKAYAGGLCYVNPKYRGKSVGKGLVLDVNSMYPFVMYNNLMPYGQPIHYNGSPKYNSYYPLFVQHIKIDFKVPANVMPIIQNRYRQIIKEKARTYLTDTKGYDLDIWVTNIELDYILEKYEVFHIEYIEGYFFKAKRGGFFKKYIERFLELKNKGKQEGNAFQKNFGKMYLNSLYGKMGSKIINPVMKPVIDDKGLLKYVEIDRTQNQPLYVPLAVFITAYGRIKLAGVINQNFERFCYCDTDSVHLAGEKVPKNLKIDKMELGAWDLEFKFERAKYLNPKKYVEENGDTLLVKCAGLSISKNKNKPDGVFDEVNFDNFEYNAKYLIKRARMREGGQDIIDCIYQIHE